MDRVEYATPRKPVTQIVADEIMAWIKSGRYKAGDSLPPEGELARQFGVSKPSVRESLRQLSAVGAVEITHGRPPSVKAVDSAPLVNFFDLAVTPEPQVLQEAIELRRALEVQSVLLATERATEEDIAVLEEIVANLERHKANIEAWAPEHYKFHVALVKAAHNRFFSFLVDALQGTILATNRMIVAKNPDRNAEETFARHLAIFEAVRSRDVAKARASMEEHFFAVDKVLRTPD